MDQKINLKGLEEIYPKLTIEIWNILKSKTNFGFKMEIQTTLWTFCVNCREALKGFFCQITLFGFKSIESTGSVNRMSRTARQDINQMQFRKGKDKKR